ncbi:MAG: HAD family hydrolase [Clostridia bacterium]|nr:HAD family hydrolase [Clostridia bacterium]
MSDIIIPYNRKPEMIFFDFGGTLFVDGKCRPADGFAALLQAAENPDAADKDALAALWDEYLEDAEPVNGDGGAHLEIPLSAVLTYAEMTTGLRVPLPMTEQEELFDRYNSTREAIEGVSAFLGALKKLGIRAAVISNNMMSGASLALAVKRWLPSSDMEFCLTSADILFMKPDAHLFRTAAKYAGVDPARCWYCGDGFHPDVKGALGAGMLPVLFDPNAEKPLSTKKYGEAVYLLINRWDALREYLAAISVFD